LYQGASPVAVKRGAGRAGSAEAGVMEQTWTFATEGQIPPAPARLLSHKRL
jgi:hypothetical protein